MENGGRNETKTAVRLKPKCLASLFVDVVHESFAGVIALVLACKKNDAALDISGSARRLRPLLI